MECVMSLYLNVVVSYKKKRSTLVSMAANYIRSMTSAFSKRILFEINYYSNALVVSIEPITIQKPRKHNLARKNYDTKASIFEIYTNDK